MKKLFFLLVNLLPFISHSQVITTIAGSGFTGFMTGSYGGDNDLANKAQLDNPVSVAVDSSGNIYIADEYNNRIRKVNISGTITTIAGNGFGAPGSGGYSGDSSMATKAELYLPSGVTVDRWGNVYIADATNQRVRKVDGSGVITTVAGNGISGYSGDGGKAITAELNNPSGIAVDKYGNLYINDENNNRIRKVNASGIISTIAGNGFGSPWGGGYSGDGGMATAAELYLPTNVAVDNFGNVYIADADNNRIRKVNTLGIITTVAGTGFGAPWGGGYSGDGGEATAAELNDPTGIAIDSYGNMYVADEDNNRIRRINIDGIINTIAGNGVLDYSGDGGIAIGAALNEPWNVAVDDSGNVYFADVGNNRIRKVSPVKYSN